MNKIKDQIFLVNNHILIRRQKLLLRFLSSVSARRAALMHYKSSPIDFIDDWMMTYDPRSTPAMLPFVMWERQKEYILWLKERYEKKEDGLVEKCRDAGVTYLSMAFSLWLFLFHEGSKVSFGSRKEALVDRVGDPDSIFEKGRILLRYLPKIILPTGFEIDKHCTFMKFVNPFNNSTITGEAGDNIGRGGRSSIYFKDESAFYERPLLIESALSQNSDVKIDMSTPNGAGNPYYHKRHGGKIPVFVFDWRDDPRKSEKWYAEQKEKLDPIIVAQEIDRDYFTSTENICIANEYLQAAINFEMEGIDSGEIVAGLDVADEGGDENCLYIRKGMKAFKIWFWKEGNTTQSARKAAFICKENNCNILMYDNIGVGAGVKGELSNKEFEWLTAIGVCTGESPTRGNYCEGKKNSDMFANLKAQLWWLMRRRIERTYEHKNKVKEYKSDELISLINDKQSITELCQPKYKFTGGGKILIESKKDMRTRGIKSPNRADAIILCYAYPFIHTKEIRFRTI